MEWGKQMNTNAIDTIYHNTRYTNERNRKRTLILDVDDSDNTHLGSATEFLINLYEPLKIDKQSEIYLDNFVTYNSNLSDSGSAAAFCLTINEFKINSTVASNSSGSIANVYNSIIIPNENNNINNYFSTVLHKSKKFNYICDINPTTISKISGKITDLSGNQAFHGSLSGTSQTYFISGLTSGGTWTVTGGNKGFIPKNASFTIESTKTSPVDDGAVSLPICRTVAGISKDSDIIYFTTTDTLTHSNYQATSISVSPTITLVFGGLGVPLTITSTTTSLDKGNGRFMAEFSIISRE